jgi:hypothetical protein
MVENINIVVDAASCGEDVTVSDHLSMGGDNECRPMVNPVQPLDDKVFDRYSFDLRTFFFHDSDSAGTSSTFDEDVDDNLSQFGGVEVTVSLEL